MVLKPIESIQPLDSESFCQPKSIRKYFESSYQTIHEYFKRYWIESSIILHEVNIWLSNSTCFELMAMIIIITYITVYVCLLFSCNSGYLKCHPLYTFEITDKTISAKDSLSGIREGLKMISYVAQDLSISDYDNKSANNYLQQIDTLSTNNLYKVNFGGFCRFNKDTMKETCLSSNGIDIFSSLVKDIGYQLGEISKSDEPSKLGDSLSTTYSHALKTLDDIYTKSIKNDTGYTNLDTEALEIIHNIYQMEYYSTVLKIVCSANLILVCLLGLLFIELWICQYFSTSASIMILLIIYLCYLGIVSLQLTLEIMSDSFLSKMNSAFEKFGIAEIEDSDMRGLLLRTVNLVQPFLITCTSIQDKLFRRRRRRI
ncbi:uncharacterized protein RJT21DRAFT_114187 [Scheffersomyces amazonensis]|uniref:uncharacterized protein n=1 Tax=Scheffersomyces amazonensis TaxID=1078765 RepID=UPI00315D90F4